MTDRFARRDTVPIARTRWAEVVLFGGGAAAAAAPALFVWSWAARFFNSRRPTTVTENESVESLFERDDCPGRLCFVRQTAGAFASRVVTAVRPGRRVPAGRKIGMIKVGSRTELYLSDAPALVRVWPGDVVRGGASVLAHQPASVRPLSQ